MNTEGINGRHDTTVTPVHPGLQSTPTQAGLGAVMPTHAEGRALTRMANQLHARGLSGGTITLYVDRAPCKPFCRPQLQKIACRLNVTIRVIGPRGGKGMVLRPGVCP
jgi:hypothetical protein